MKIFGQRLKELREDKKLSQRQLAKTLGTSQPNLQRWEKGLFEPDQNTMIVIADENAAYAEDHFVEGFKFGLLIGIEAGESNTGQ